MYPALGQEAGRRAISGRMIEVKLAAPSLKGNLLGDPVEQSAAIYLPPSYDTAPSKRYATLYLLHGFGGDGKTWSGEGPFRFNIAPLLDAMIKITTDAGEIVVTDTYIINGKEVEFTQKVNEQESKGKRTSKSLADGSGFESSEEIIREVGDGTKITQQVTRRWVMTPEGKAFTVEMTVYGPNGTQHTKRTFVKK